MFRSALLASVFCMLVASAAFADAPESLMKGNWSLGYTADSGSPSVNYNAESASDAIDFGDLIFGYQVANMVKIAGNFGLASIDPGGDIDSATMYRVGGTVHYYVDGLSNQYFSPFLGGNFTYIGYSGDPFEGKDGDFAFNIRFGGEAFPVAPLSVGGYIGFEYLQEGDYGDEEGSTFMSVNRSALFVSLYW